MAADLNLNWTLRSIQAKMDTRQCFEVIKSACETETTLTTNLRFTNMCQPDMRGVSGFAISHN